MATIGNLGEYIVFSVSSDKVLTFNKMTQTVKGRWTNHNVIGKKPKSEFLGADIRSLNLSIKLDVMLGVKPIKVLKTLEHAVEDGSIFPFILGGKKVGSNSWVITQMSETWDCVYSKGELIKASVSLTLQEYV